jgi:thiol:disulfide interchange protein
MNVRASALFVVLVLSACRTPAEATLPYRIEEADEAKKPLVVEFYATWCGPCKWFEANVLTDARVQAELTKVHFIRYDGERPSGSDAMRRCRANAFPTIVAIDRGGTVRLFKVGASGGVDEFLSFLAQTQAVLGHQWVAK